MSGVLDGSSTPCVSRQARGRVHIASDSTIPNVFVRLFSSSKQRRDMILRSSPNTEVDSHKAPFARHQSRMSLARSRRALQQTLNPPQPTVTTCDVPGTGGGKENMPPGMSTSAKNKNKADRPPASKTTRQVPNAPRRRVSTQINATRKQSERVALGETRGNTAAVPKRVADTPASNVPVSLSKRALSAIVIQRAWRSFLKRRNHHTRATVHAIAREEWAHGVIARWWRSVKAGKPREQTETIEQMTQVEQVKQTKTKLRKSAGQQPARQSVGRRGIRRL